jgi:phosphoribosylformimino-5-aminoimidazole carboxamide ribotide isomerase
MDIIPAVDIKGGKCVRLRQGERSQETIYGEDPVLMAQKWQNAGARLLHIVDLDGAWAGKPQNYLVIQRIISSVNIPIQVGGGIRDFAAIRRYLDIGIERIILGSSALKNPSFIEEMCNEYPDKILLGIDTKEDYVAYDGWENVSEKNAIDVALQFQDSSIRAFIFTDICRDGMLEGPNIKAIEKFARKVNKPILAAGGIKSLEDILSLIKLEEIGLEGIIVGRALYEGTLDLREALERINVR